MDIDVLKEIITLAEKRSYAAAAEELFTSQSSLSRHIAAAEKQLGVQLFYRNSRQVTLTKGGEALLPYAREIVTIEKEYRGALDTVIRSERVELRIGSVMGLSAFGIMSHVAGFIAENKDIHISMLRQGEGNLKDLLKEGACDFIFSQETQKETDDGMCRLNAVCDELVVVLPVTHPLAEQKRISLCQLKGEEWFIQRERELLTRKMNEVFEHNNFVPRLSDLNAEGVGVLELVEKGVGICMESRMIAEEKKIPGIALVSLMKPEHIYVNLIWRNVPLSRAGKLFVSYMKTHIKH